MSGIRKVAIIGSGVIGQNWCLVFISSNIQVNLYDNDKVKLSESKYYLISELKNYENFRILRGEGSAEEYFKRITFCNTLQECVHGVDYIQECIPEHLEAKKIILQEISRYITTAIIASSTSCILPSVLANDLPKKENLLVVHPVNPPYCILLVEVVPSQWTSEQVIKDVANFMSSIGQKPVVLKKEIEGFVLNRLQYSILNECWHLVSENILSPKDVDLVMTEGLAPRYIFNGPLETAHMNASGFIDYCNKYGKTIMDVIRKLGPPLQIHEDAVINISNQLCVDSPITSLEKHRTQRNFCLSSLLKFKNDMKTKL